MTASGASSTAGAVRASVEPAAGPRVNGRHGLGTELEILLACARMRLEEPYARRIRDLLRRDPDWGRLFQLATYHRLTSFVYHHLNRVAAELVPDDMLEFFRQRFVQNATEALRQTADLLEVLDLLERGGVLAVPYKGPALAVRAYGNLAFRRCCDLDIVVGRQDVARAQELLKEGGFRPRIPLSPAGREFLVRNRHSEVFVRDPGPVVELHWAFAKGELAFALDLERLRPRLQEVSLGSSRVPVFGIEDALLILSVHGANHRWDRLEWLCGLAELVRNEEIAWAEAIARAAELRAEKTLFLGLLLAHDLLESPVPEDVLDRARSYRDVVMLARIVRERLATAPAEAGPSPSPLPRDLFRLRLQSTSRDRLRYLLYRLTTPGREDTRLMLPLGRRSVPLAALTRPFRVMGKLVDDLIRKR